MRGTNIALASCAFGAMAPIFEKTLLLYMSPIALAALRSLTAGILLLFVMEAVHKIKEIGQLSRRDAFLILVIIGMVGVFAPLFYLSGLKTTSVANTLLILRLSSLMIAVFAWLFLKEKLTMHQVTGSVLMVCGLLVIFSRGFSVGYRFLPGDLYLAGASLLAASSAVLMKKYLHHIPPEVLVVSRNTIGGMVIMVFAFQDVSSIPMTPEIPLYLGGLAIFGVILAQVLWYSALERTKAINVGLCSISVPIFGTFFAVMFLGEKIAAYQVIGGALVLFGLIAIELHLSSLSIKKLERRLKLRWQPHH